MEYLGLGKTAFTGWKNGDNASYKKHIDKIAEFFGVSTDYLLGVEHLEKAVTVTDDDIKFALFDGDKDITDEMYNEVKEFAKYVKNKYKKE